MPVFHPAPPTPEHSTYFGTDDKLGAVAVSIRREKLEDTKDLKDQFQYRLILRTNEVLPVPPSTETDRLMFDGHVMMWDSEQKQLSPSPRNSDQGMGGNSVPGFQRTF